MPAPPPNVNDPGEDAQLVAAVQAGDLRSFDPLVERHLDAIHAFAPLKLPLAHLPAFYRLRKP